MRTQMGERRDLLFLLIMISALQLTACTSSWGRATEVEVRYSGRGPDPLVGQAEACETFDAMDTAAPEEIQYMDDAAGLLFPGLLRGESETSPAGRTRYIFHTHGMGSTDRCGFANGLLRHLRERGYRAVVAASDWTPAPTRTDHHIRGEGLDCSGERASSEPCLYSDFGEHRVDRLRGPGGDTVVVYSYYWHWDLWQVQYRYLGDDLSQNPGLLSGILKQTTVDEGLSDAAAYLGELDYPLREGMASTICAMLKDAAGVPGGPPSGLSDCIGRDQRAEIEARDIQFSFISHSLGSRMLFDVLAGYAEPDTDERPDEEGEEAYRLLAERTATFFMAANQLPLLGPGGVRRSTD